VLGGGEKKIFDGFGDELSTRPYIRCRFGGAKDIRDGHKTRVCDSFLISCFFLVFFPILFSISADVGQYPALSNRDRVRVHLSFLVPGA